MTFEIDRIAKRLRKAEERISYLEKIAEEDDLPIPDDPPPVMDLYWRLNHGTGGEEGIRGEGFDELVIGNWFHIEMMNEAGFWLRVGEKNFDLEWEDGELEVRERDEPEPNYDEKLLWLEFVGEHCGLCGNSGVIDTRGRMFTAAGVECGVRAFCICPNGRARKKAGADLDKSREGGAWVGDKEYWEAPETRVESCDTCHETAEACGAAMEETKKDFDTMIAECWDAIGEAEEAGTRHLPTEIVKLRQQLSRVATERDEARASRNRAFEDIERVRRALDANPMTSDDCLAAAVNALQKRANAARARVGELERDLANCNKSGGAAYRAERKRREEVERELSDAKRYGDEVCITPEGAKAIWDLFHKEPT